MSEEPETTESFTITINHAINETDPPNSITNGATYPHDEEQFSNVLAGSIFAMRAMQEIWGNGSEFGGNDLVRMACRFLIAMNEKEESSGLWHWDDPQDAIRDGYQEQNKVRANAVEAARKYLNYGEEIT